jgi:MOSC domain-containing protein YiiM
MTGRVESINTSRGGVPKTPVFEALVTKDGLDGDQQRDEVYHGGPNRAVVLFSLEVIQALQAEGHPIQVGSTGENLTVSGVPWTEVTPGAELRIGSVRLRITKYASPCGRIRRSFLDHDFNRIAEDRHAGWSRVCAAVVEGGVVRVGDPVEISTAPQ